jgi:thiamine-monophosphate kinase
MSDERDKLKILRRILAKTSSPDQENGVLVGVDAQDDAAVLRLRSDLHFVISSDFIRGTQFYLFQLGYLNHFDVGYYLVVANLSDIAAMGAHPVGLTTVIRYGPTQTDEQFEQIFLGIRSAADRYGVSVVGGDTGSYSADVFAATAFGLADNGKVLLRSGARSDDLLCVTGLIGLPIAAIAYFKRARQAGLSLTPEEEERLLNSWKRPVPRIQEGIILCKNEIAHACQDISDGLKETIEQVARLSHVNFTVYADRLPIDGSTVRVAEFLGVSAPQLAMSASVDFQLLFTMSASAKGLCDSVMGKQGLTYHIIGEVNSAGQNLFVHRDGRSEPLPGTGWNHQEGDLLQQVLSGR